MKLRPADRAMFQRIRVLVEKTHWTKNAYHAKRGDKDMFCLVGFIEKEVGLREDLRRGFWRHWGHKPRSTREQQQIARAERAYQALMEAIQKRHPRSEARGVETWNDGRGTNRERVLGVLDEILEGEPQAK